MAHNAQFDVKFLNYEMKAFGFPTLDKKRVLDTLEIARKKFPGSPANLDALCRRFGIDNSNRELHGALLDSELLAEVYLELLGGRQRGLSLAQDDTKIEATIVEVRRKREFREPREFMISEDEKAAHAKMVEDLIDPLWKFA